MPARAGLTSGVRGVAWAPPMDDPDGPGVDRVRPRSRKEPAVAILAIFDAPGHTQAQYDQVRRRVAPDNRLLPGMLYHAAGTSETGFCVVEVWESQEALQRFFEQTLSQLLQEAGMNVQPRFFQLSNTMET